MNQLRKARIFMDCPPFVRQLVLSTPYYSVITLTKGELLPNVLPSVKDVDYIFVLRGAVDIVCETILTSGSTIFSSDKSHSSN